MERVKVLIVDLLENSEEGDEVQRILSCPEDHREKFTLKSLSIGELPDGSADLIKSVASSDARLFLLLISSKMIRQAETIISQISEIKPGIPILVIGRDLSQPAMMELLRLGASDYVVAPLKAIDLLPRIWRLILPLTEQIEKRLTCKFGLEMIIGKDEVFRAEVQKIPLVAKCDAGVLIIGETGTGKELFARAIHYLSPRSGYPFIAVNCGAIPQELIENELFGHIRGAYTGAHTFQPGLIREANSGTLFLDDVESLPLPAQAKLLRFLQEKEYRPLGSAKTLRADVRIVSATNIDPEEACRVTFRPDLFYRLNVVPLNLPPLRNRETDIPLLAKHFLEKYAFEFRQEVKVFSSKALSRLMDHDWPGNVRELENIVGRAVVFATGPVVEMDQIILPRKAGLNPLTRQGSFKAEKAKMIWQFEKDYIEKLLFQHNGNITQAAKAAQKNRRAFWELIRKYKIEVTGRYPMGQDKSHPKQDKSVLSAIP